MEEFEFIGREKYVLASEASALIETLRTAAIADAARIAELELLLKFKQDALAFADGARLEWFEMYMRKRDAIARFKAGLIRAGAKIPLDPLMSSEHEQGLSAALVSLKNEIEGANKRNYADLAKARKEQQS